MVKVKVMTAFVDRHTKHRHPVGEVFEATEERISEINAVNPKLIQVINESADKVEAPKRTRKQVKDNE